MADYTVSMLNGAEIKRRREKIGYTLDEAAQKAGLGGRQNWYRVEAGIRDSVSLETAVKIADVLGCKVDDILNKRG